jgi:hypothetical protein
VYCTFSYGPGDKFKITVNAFKAGSELCTDMPLGIGDSFEMTAGNNVGGGPDSCPTHAADGTIPDFAKGPMTTCEPGEGRLSELCQGVASNGCAVTMTMQFGAVPAASQGVVEHAPFEFTLSDGAPHAGGGFCYAGTGCPLVQYDVRIERLGPGADN